jgi:hypothetical protein
MFGCGCGFGTVAGNAFSWSRFFRCAAKAPALGGVMRRFVSEITL